MTEKAIGHIGWIDLTVADAPGLRHFYQQVVGWTGQGLNMGDYEDYMMTAPDGTCAAGICHARGSNAGLPATWLMYINVANLDESLSQCLQLGGEVVVGPKEMGGHGRYGVIRDPAGAICALFQHPASGGE